MESQRRTVRIENRKKFLKKVYQMCGGDTAININGNDAGLALGFTIKDTQTIIGDLVESGYIRFAPGKNEITLTHFGQAEAERVNKIDEPSHEYVQPDYIESDYFTNENGSKVNERVLKDNLGVNDSMEENDALKAEGIVSDKKPFYVRSSAIDDSIISIENDSLNYSVYVDAIVDFLSHEETKPPFTLAITGEWGSGKSTLMQWVKDKLDLKDYKTVWFTAWRNTGKEAIWAAFAKKVLADTLTTSLTFKLRWRRLKDALPTKKIRVRFLIAAGVILSILFLLVCFSIKINFLVFILPFIVLTLPFIKPVIKSLSSPVLRLYSSTKGPDYERTIGFQSEFEKDFSRVVELVTEKSGKPLVIFIDDLDRAPPPTPVEIIEALNILVGHKKCIFVIGMDITIVAASIEAKYKDVLERLGDKADSFGRNFVEKLVQLTFSIPLPDRSAVETYLESILGIERSKDQIEEESKIDGIEDIKDSAKNKENYFTIAAKEFIESSEVHKAIKLGCKLISENPRKIKRFVNTFRLVAFVANRRNLVESGVVDLNILAYVTVAEIEYPEIYNILLGDGATKLLNNFKNWVRTVKSVEDDFWERQGFSVAKYKNSNCRVLASNLLNVERDPYLTLTSLVK